MWNVRLKLLAAAGFASAALLMAAAAPEGWFLAGTNPANYDTGVDLEAVYKSHPSAFLKAKEAKAGFGTLLQNCLAEQYLGKRVRFSGFVKSDKVANWAGLWMRVDGKNASAPLGFDNMQDRAIKGTTGWQRYEVVLDVPKDAVRLYYGILLTGTGEVWLNTANIEVVGPDVHVTGTSFPAAPNAPRNLGFDK